MKRTGKPKAPNLNTLPYRKPQLGRDYWIKDDALANVDEVSRRCFARTDWVLGQPWKTETWPGMRSANALLPDELAGIEAWVQQQTGAKRLWNVSVNGDAALNHNHVQLVGATDSGPRPHTDSRTLCRYAAVIYLSPDPDSRAGTSFYRLRLPGGALGGNYCPAPHANLREALNVTHLRFSAWSETLAIPNVYNRLLLYRAEFVHSASGYFGSEHHDKRMTAVFFWMA